MVVAGGTAVGAAQSDKTSAILAFAGAVLVALLTWYATDRRQHAAIEAEERRQRALFDEEAKRQARELEHRDRADLRAHFREFLDDAARVYEDAHRSLVAVVVALQHAPENEDQRAHTALAAADATRAMQLVFRRMFLRLPGSHPVTISVHGGAEAMVQATDLLPAPNNRAFDADQLLRDLDAAGDSLTQHMFEFSEAVRELVGVEDALSRN